MGQVILRHARTPGPPPGAAGPAGSPGGAAGPAGSRRAVRPPSAGRADGPARARRALIALGALTLLILGALLATSSSAGAHGGAPIALPQTRPQSDGFPELSQVFPARALSPADHRPAHTPESTPRLLSELLAHVDRPPHYLIAIYRRAGSRYGVPWQVLAAIGAIETNSGRDLAPNPTVGLGWLRFVPATWRAYGIAADHRSEPVPYDPHDAILTAAHLLALNGAGHDLPHALLAYNHEGWYVQAVLREAARLGGPASWRHATLQPGWLRSTGRRTPAASSITLQQALAVARFSDTTSLASADAAATLLALGGPVPGAVVPQAPWNPQLKPIAGWIVPVLQWASAHGWTGVVTSGYRTYAEQAAINALGLFSAPAGSSNHEATTYPGGAVDVTDPGRLIRVLAGYGGPYRLVGGVLGPVDPEHFSATGH